MTIETKMNAPAGANAEARALKAANDARIEEIEKRGAVDPVRRRTELRRT